MVGGKNQFETVMKYEDELCIDWLSLRSSACKQIFNGGGGGGGMHNCVSLFLLKVSVC